MVYNRVAPPGARALIGDRCSFQAIALVTELRSLQSMAHFKACDGKNLPRPKMKENKKIIIIIKRNCNDR